MKRVISILCSFLMCLTVGLTSACGNKDTNEYLLTIGYDNGGYGLTWLENVVEKFCEQEGISVDQVFIEAEKDYTSQVNDKLVNSTALNDVFIISASNGAIREWASQGFLEPLDEVFEMKLASADRTVYDSVVDKRVVEAGKYNDNYYSFPADVGASGIYYNKTMFDEKGWEVPKTYDELVALCENIYNVCVKNVKDKEEQIYPFVCSTDINQYWDFVVMDWIGQLIGKEAFDEFCELENETIYSVDSVYGQAKIKALKAWNKIAVENAEHFVVDDSVNFLASQILFAQGKVAMMPNGSWFEKEISASLPAGMEIGIMETPYIDGARKDDQGNYIKVSGGGEASGYVIPADAENKEMAKKFLAFLAEEDVIKQRTIDSGSFSPFVCDYSSVVDKFSFFQKSVYNIYNGAERMVFVSNSPIVAAGMGVGFWIKGNPYTAILTGESTPEDFVKGEEAYANTEWKNILERAQI